jgi:branched-chain amino acid transport system substrate-binding protein
VALAMLPVAEEYKKILLVEPAVADSITGDKWNKYIFRTGRNSQDAISNAVAMDKAGVTIATLAQDYAFGRDGVKAFKEALKNAKIVHEEYLPQHHRLHRRRPAPDRQAQGPARPQGDLHHLGRRHAAVQDRRPGPQALRHRDRHGRQHPAGHGRLQELPRHGRRHLLLLRHSQEPGQRGAGGHALQAVQGAARLLHRRRLSAAMAIVTALKKTNGDTNTNKLIKTMEGMSFETPKGKMTFRKEDHQAMQSMYHFKIKVDPAFAWGVPELVREIKPEEMKSRSATSAEALSVERAVFHAERSTPALNLCPC